MRRGRLAILAAGIALAAGLAAVVAGRAGQDGQMTAGRLRFIDHPETVSGGGASLTVRGYLVATVHASVDPFAPVDAQPDYLKVEATRCGSEARLGAWFEALPQDVSAGGSGRDFLVLVPMRHDPIDLARTTDDVCLRLTGPTRGLWASTSRWLVRVAIDPATRQEMQDFERDGGIVTLTPDAGCAPRLCQSHARRQDAAQAP